ncbi:ATP-binding protein [Streptomyces hygroscopicus subsp. hygroscopicus]|uniref:ATP-binding protein n=1 Tax=Streptomyces hygroscopicus TaxID=1912 RepID=UPI001C659BF5|nr:ATP-binding protein [Streptomyces hygroscopicus]MBW8087747.1 ATP-binding protein [Streptomyces hygroscopicus subsp. hygroscopicus]
MPTATADRRDTFRVSRDRQHVPSARARVRKTLAAWGVESALADDVTLSADELLSNAIKHCRVTFAEIEITVSVQGGALLLEVSDPDKGKIPELHIADSDDETGRGLFLVARLADEWGHRYRTYAKCVWARFVIPDGDTCTD